MKVFTSYLKLRLVLKFHFTLTLAGIAAILRQPFACATSLWSSWRSWAMHYLSYTG